MNLINEKNVFRNPVVAQAADPWVMKHTDGQYYFMHTRSDRLELVQSASLARIGEGKRKVIWNPEPGGAYSRNLWAPEIHHAAGKWYVYFTANDGGGDETRRICVLENERANPLEGEWTWKGALDTPVPGLDGTVFTLRGELYFLYAGYGHFPDYGSAIYIMRMSSPIKVAGDHVLLTAPTMDWEKQGGMAINEGPVLLHRNGRVFLVYSASTTWSEDYSLGMLTMNEQDDPMIPSSWSKSDKPVFKKIRNTPCTRPDTTVLPSHPMTRRIGSFTMRSPLRERIRHCGQHAFSVSNGTKTELHALACHLAMSKSFLFHPVITVSEREGSRYAAFVSKTMEVNRSFSRTP